MKQTKIIMGMPITVEIVGSAQPEHFTEVFKYFRSIDSRFSPYKPRSELSQINRGLPKSKWSKEMKTVLDLCEVTKRETKGYFDIMRQGKLDPSGLVKGWSIQNAADILSRAGYKNFYIEAGGDIQVAGLNSELSPWVVGIRNPFNLKEIIKAVSISTEGVATSGTYIRGEHVYNPHRRFQAVSFVKSLTVIGPNIYDADRFATAAFAMGEQGIVFLEELSGFEAYMVDAKGIATYTRGFEKYVVAATV